MSPPRKASLTKLHARRRSSAALHRSLSPTPLTKQLSTTSLLTTTITEHDTSNGIDDNDNDDESFTDDDTSSLFYALKAKNLDATKDLLTIHPTLVDADLGVDYRFDISKGRKHYTYTGDPDNGFCTVFHIAAESGSKEMILYLKTLSNDYDIEDFRDKIPSEMATGEAADAFLEIAGKKLEPYEYYVGDIDPLTGLKHGNGKIIKKLEGYAENEFIHYEGRFQNDMFHGKGVMYYPGNDNNCADVEGEKYKLNYRMYERVKRARAKSERAIRSTTPTSCFLN